MNAVKRLYRTREFAELAGVTVRTLHHYDRLGLLKPSGRTAAGYRLYGGKDLARLQQIVTLKFIGLPLAQIKDLLGSRTFDLGSTLRLQREIMQEKRRQFDAALAAIAHAERTISGNGPDWDALRRIVEVIEMQSNMDWTRKYYSEEAKAKIAERNAADPDAAERGQHDWAVLIADVERALREGISPESECGHTLAARWKALIHAFTGGNAEVEAGLKGLYSDQQNWPATFKKPYSDEVGDFICRAGAARKGK